MEGTRSGGREGRAGFWRRRSFGTKNKTKREARRGAQLERACPLLAGDGEGAAVAGGRVGGGTAGREEQVAVEAVKVSV